ncbi:uncharacterized protein LOC126550070 isoform X2 [Aphis gossypii]|nr:uncharacterized protein LOC126550070 isoform X2 [Aphis gossypii]
MKPWIMEDSEKTKQDVAFEKIIHLDFWTYNAICLLSCLFPLIGKQIEVITMQQLKTSTNKWRIITVFVLVVGNLVPACFSFNFPGIQKKAGSAYNLLFQDICKLGILTVDLQFAWFCWSLEDEFLRLNDILQQMTVSSEIPTAMVVKGQSRKTMITERNNYYHRYDVYRVEVAYAKLMRSATLVCSVCEERVLMNASCYMFNTICGLFDTISAYRTRGAPLLLAIMHLSWVLNCAGRIALMCFAASSVVDQDDRLHDLAQIARETLGVYGECWEMKRLSRRLRHSKMKFDVCGMVTVDKTLLSSAVISVISYLVIVLQYNYS